MSRLREMKRRVQTASKRSRAIASDRERSSATNRPLQPIGSKLCFSFLKNMIKREPPILFLLLASATVVYETYSAKWYVMAQSKKLVTTDTLIMCLKHSRGIPRRNAGDCLQCGRRPNPSAQKTGYGQRRDSTHDGEAHNADAGLVRYFVQYTGQKLDFCDFVQYT